MKYVALLRGIGPGNPNMHQKSLKHFFESLGFKKVLPVISSGNVVFEIEKADKAKLEEKIEEELPKKLGFSSRTIIRSEIELKELISKNPFRGVVDEKPNYLLITFFKDGREEMATVLNLDENKTTDFMAKMDREHKKEITSRTWKTVNRIFNKMQQ